MNLLKRWRKAASPPATLVSLLGRASRFNNGQKRATRGPRKVAQLNLGK
jgi:hypothetical protein